MGGFDVNRDFAADLSDEPDQADFPGRQEGAGSYVTPEARALRDLYVELQASSDRSMPTWTFTPNGSATVLFEVRGQSHTWGQKKMGQVTHIVKAGVLGIAERMADDSVDDLDPNDFHLLPKYW